jgi:hypothetical protein
VRSPVDICLGTSPSEGAAVASLGEGFSALHLLPWIGIQDRADPYPKKLSTVCRKWVMEIGLAT